MRAIPLAFPALLLVLTSCTGGASGSTNAARAGSPPRSLHRAASAGAGGGTAARLEWQSETSSPRPLATDPELGFCGAPDLALTRTAANLAEREARGLPQRDAPELAFFVRASGGPYVWPHAWTLSARDLSTADVPGRLRRFLSSFSDIRNGDEGEGGERRCGVSRARGPDGTEAVAAVVADVLGDLDPVPVEARAGQWIRFSAHLLAPARGAKLVVLGPVGTPHPVPTTLHDGHVEAIFSVDRRGPWTAQLVATVAAGPRPVLEAELFVDTEPPSSFAQWPAPGEEDGSDEEPSGLVAMVNAARRSEDLPRLRESAAMARVAALHAARMRDRRLLAHDAGDGDPVARLRDAGLDPLDTGENVAHALGLRRAHRALWMSPSHRGNMLDARFDTLGVGVARDTDGSLWVCEVFGDFAGSGMPRTSDSTY